MCKSYIWYWTCIKIKNNYNSIIKRQLNLKWTNDVKTFLQRMSWTVSDHMKRWQSSLTIMVDLILMQIKTVLTYCFAPGRMTSIENKDSYDCQGCGESRSLIPWWPEGKTVGPLWDTIWQFPKRLNKVTIKPSNSTTIEIKTNAHAKTTHKCF